MAMLQAETATGAVQGARGNNRGFTVFRGIPYAEAPVGALRFAPPQPAKPWAGVRDCTAFAPACVQKPGSDGLYIREFYPEPKVMDEDCLYLNVWTPAEAAGEGLPVFFWIHGGAFLHGYSYEMEFDGEAMCKRGAILVTIGYRCSAFGFLAHPELTRRHGRSGNAGLEDQMLALGWVRENIAAFGGDPENITVHGQSAGAMSTRALLASPRCKGMMNRAIVQSGGGINDWSAFRTMAEQEALGVQVLERAGMTLPQAMTLPAEEVFTRLFAAGMEIFPRPPKGGMGFQPCIDGLSLVEPVGESILHGRLNTDSILCGSVLGDYGVSAQLPPDDPDLAQKRRVTAFAAQVAWGEWNLRQGRRPLYGYFFDRALPGDDLGSWHSCELWYMFGTMARCWRRFTGYDYELSEAMVDYWCNFARTGDPNGGGLPRWEPYTAATPEVMCFSDGGFGGRRLGEEPFARELLPHFMTPGMVGEIR